MRRDGESESRPARIRFACYDPDILDGWGKRATNWEFAASVRHELLPRMSVDVGYFRRWFYGFLVTDNLHREPRRLRSVQHHRRRSIRGCRTAAARSSRICST